MPEHIPKKIRLEFSESSFFFCALYLKVSEKFAKISRTIMRRKACLFLAAFLLFLALEVPRMPEMKYHTQERNFQRRLKKEIEQRLPGAIVGKIDFMQGIPDLLILYKNKWGMLEVKRDENAPHRPNQDFYVDKFNSMSFARFIYPENKKEVLDELCKALEP